MSHHSEFNFTFTPLEMLPPPVPEIQKSIDLLDRWDLSQMIQICMTISNFRKIVLPVLWKKLGSDAHGHISDIIKHRNWFDFGEKRNDELLFPGKTILSAFRNQSLGYTIPPVGPPCPPSTNPLIRLPLKIYMDKMGFKFRRSYGNNIVGLPNLYACQHKRDLVYFENDKDFEKELLGNKKGKNKGAIPETRRLRYGMAKDLYRRLTDTSSYKWANTRYSWQIREDMLKLGFKAFMRSFNYTKGFETRHSNDKIIPQDGLDLYGKYNINMYGWDCGKIDVGIQRPVCKPQMLTLYEWDKTANDDWVRTLGH